MKRWVSNLPIPPIQKWQSRAEILREHNEQLEQSRLLGLKSILEGIKREFYTRKYDPDQPRVPAGNSDGGQWTSEGNSGEGLVERIMAIAKRMRLAASPASYRECLKQCAPLLERPKPYGWSDVNKYDFHRCMSACLRGKP